MPYFKQACFSSGEACILSSWLSNQVREEKAPNTIFVQLSVLLPVWSLLEHRSCQESFQRLRDVGSEYIAYTC